MRASPTVPTVHPEFPIFGVPRASISIFRPRALCSILLTCGKSVRNPNLYARCSRYLGHHSVSCFLGEFVFDHPNFGSPQATAVPQSAATCSAARSVS